MPRSPIALALPGCLVACALAGCDDATPAVTSVDVAVVDTPSADAAEAASLDAPVTDATTLDAGADASTRDAPREDARADAVVDAALDAACADGGARCGGACVDLSRDVSHCGACGHACVLQGATAACAAGRCAVARCDVGRGDCDGDATNGCEVDTARSLAHCGACGRACAPTHATGACAEGRCAARCDEGFGDCDGDASNGCEVDLRSAPSHCGACGRACAAPANGDAACRGGACAVSCAPGYCAAELACAAGGARIDAPRPVAPVSTSAVTTRRPTFLWALPTGVEGARVEVCADRACARVVTAFDAAGDSGRPGVDLPDGVLFWRLRGRAVACTGAPSSATWQLTVPRRRAGVDASWGATADLNGDGHADVVVGARGAVYVFAGAASGAMATPSTLAAPAGVTGFGRAVSAAGDVNGDGYADLLVGSDAAAFVYAGGAAGIAAAPAMLSAPAGVTGWARAVAAAGDVDGDGYGDALVGAAEGAFVLRGSPTGLGAATALRVTGRDVGASVREAGDTDGDGLSDVIVGAPGVLDGAERAAVLRGADLSLATSLTRAATTPAGFGASVAGVGDVNGDGFADVAVGAPQGDLVALFAGGASGVSTTALATWRGARGFGGALSGAGDVNADGVDDVIVGVASGDAVLYLSAPSMAHRAVPLAGALGDGAAADAAVAGVGDVNRDGFDDVAVGAPSAGQVLLYTGGRDGVAGAPVILRAPAGATGFGAAIARGPY